MSVLVIHTRCFADRDPWGPLLDHVSVVANDPTHRFIIFVVANDPTHRIISRPVKTSVPIFSFLLIFILRTNANMHILEWMNVMWISQINSFTHINHHNYVYLKDKIFITEFHLSIQVSCQLIFLFLFYTTYNTINTAIVFNNIHK